MDILIQVNSGYIDTIMPSLIMALKLKSEGTDVTVFFEWRALVAFVEQKFDYSSSVAKYASTIEENAKKMGVPVDPMYLLKGAKAAGIPMYGCAVEAALTGIAEKVPSEIELMEEKDLSKPFLEAKKITGEF
jgi:peroxiredoxin family protein